MQINSQLPVLHTPVTRPEESLPRLPVVFDKRDDTQINAQPVYSRPVVPITENNDGQQAQFVRHFSLSYRQNEQENNASIRLSPQLQAYLQVEAIEDHSLPERLFDAMA